MAEKFTVYGTLRDSTAVYGYIFGVFAVRQGMDDLWDHFFADPAFPGYQNGNIRRGHLYGFFQRPVELHIVANDLKTLLYGLN